MKKISLSLLKERLRWLVIHGIGANLLWKFEKIIPRYSLIGDKPFFAREQFNWVPQLEANWEIIRKELDEILQYRDHLPNFQDISPDQIYRTSKDDMWKTYFLYGYGMKAENNCKLCPETARILEQIPGVKTAFFSILLPGKHIPEHRGPYKGFIRCLLGLKIPEPREKCRIRVGNEVRHWEEGKCMIFDDAFPHEAWNETDEMRVVLFIDFVRPLGFPMNLVNQLVINIIAMTPFVQDANRNQKYWDERLEQVMSQKAKQKQLEKVLTSK
jgi:aspartyl/asparaginyl beta-hydroxylase (cupin superfamily)